jgi:glycosyltransferase involved in cell wall biosynthesis
VPSPLRLLIASQPLDGGVARHVIDIVSCLPRERFTIDVACPRTSDVWAALAGRPGVTLHPISPARAPSPADLVTLARLLPLARRADVIHAHSSKAGFLARLAALLTGRRRRCLFTPNGWSFWVAGGTAGRLYTMLERLAARWCRTIVAVSVEERTAALERGIGTDDQFVVIPNGIALERFTVPPQPVPGRVVMVGRLAPQKRPDLLVRAFARLCDEFPDARLHIAGDGPLQADVRALVEELGLENVVELLGSRSDIPEILSGAACVALPSAYEGAPYALLEAMAAGAPVVATTVGGIPETIEDGRTGLLVPPGDVDSLTTALRNLLADPPAAAAMGAAAREAAARDYSREKMTLRLVDEYVAAAAG